MSKKRIASPRLLRPWTEEIAEIELLIGGCPKLRRMVKDLAEYFDPTSVVLILRAVKKAKLK